MASTSSPSKTNTRSFHLRVFGCQMNFYDGELIRASLIKHGYSEAQSAEEADVVLFHTCSVRENAEERVHGLLGECRRLKRQNPSMVLGVIGCMADREAKSLFDREPHVDIVCGSRHFPELGSMVARIESGEERICEVGKAEQAVDRKVRDLTGRESHWSAHVAVMRGCDLNCTYCIVPSVRGRVESRPLEEIIHEVQRLLNSGVTEIQLLGQTIDAYGRDLPKAGRPSLARLLDQLAPMENLQRLRMITLHPSYVDRELAQAMARSPQFMRFLPIPLQAGSDRILKAMKRGYDVGLYRKRIDLLRSEMPDLELVSDWIVGFPGETDEDFAQSVQAMKEFAFLQSYVFQYSPRPGTSAHLILDDVPTDVKKERNIQLLDLQREIARKLSPTQVGATSSMLLEQESKHHPQHWLGRTHNGHPVVLPFAESLTPGAKVPIQLENHDGRVLLASQVQPATFPAQGKGTFSPSPFSV